MSAVSGQNNTYKIDLHRDSSSPVTHINIHTDRTSVKGNFITLGFSNALMIKSELPNMNAYVKDRLQNLGAQLVTWFMPSFAHEVLAGRAKVNDEAPSHIKVANYVDARKVIDTLFKHNEMSAEDRADIENSLRELEKSGEFASKITESVTVAQKEVIQSVILPYIDDIKSEAPDSETAKKWITCAANALSICGPTVAREKLSDLLFTACKSGHEKGHAFYDSLFAVSKIYVSMGDLEGALAQLGSAMPSKTLIQQAILGLFD